MSPNQARGTGMVGVSTICQLPRRAAAMVSDETGWVHGLPAATSRSQASRLYAATSTALPLSCPLRSIVAVFARTRRVQTACSKAPRCGTIRLGWTREPGQMQRGVFLVGAGCALIVAATMAHSAGAPPDVSGTYWATSYSAKLNLVGGGDPPLNAAGKAAYDKIKARLKDGSLLDKARRVCVPDGVPRVMASPYPFEIFQTPEGQVTMLFEMNHQVRVIVMDRPLPKLEGLITDLRYNGHLVGHFEGDTLV